MNTKILGSAFTLTSSIKMAEIKKLKKFSPASLQMKDAETKKNVVYAIGAGPAAITANGVSFNGENADGYAQCTMEIPAGVDNKAAYVKENFGLAMLGLVDMEAHVAAELEALEGKFATVSDSIEVVD